MRDRSQPVLPAGGLALRPWEAGDAPVVLAAYQDAAVKQWNLRTFASLAEAGAWIAQWERQWQAERDGCWALTDGAGTVLGRVVLRGDPAAGRRGRVHLLDPAGRPRPGRGHRGDRGRGPLGPW
jgi:RimJ/RimL family protein N-acetyltransferase